MSLSLGSWYRRVKHDPTSDIAYHFPAFAAVCDMVHPERVVELGVREGHSTAAWLWNLRHGGYLWSVDIVQPPIPPRGRWTLIVGNDLDPDVASQLPDPIDVLFVDTCHAYDHTVAELALYGPRVRPGGVILLHDTANEHPEDHGEPIGPQEPFPVRRAAQEYAAAHGYQYGEDEASWGLGAIKVG